MTDADRSSGSRFSAVLKKEMMEKCFCSNNRMGQLHLFMHVLFLTASFLIV
jgi:hypothetical protein